MTKRAKQSAPAPEVQVETLLARCSRENLELLLARHVRDGSVPQLQDVLALLPEARRGLKMPKPAPVKDGEARTGTGYFDDLDDEILADILGRLATEQRFACVMTVCKAWRRLGGLKELWTDLSLHPWKLPNGRNLDGQGMLRLLSWLPDRADVRTLRLSSGSGGKSDSSLSPESIKRVRHATPLAAFARRAQPGRPRRRSACCPT